MTVYAHSPCAIELIQVGEEVLVEHLDRSYGRINRGDTDILVDLLDLPKVGVDLPVGEDQSVDQEIPVTRRSGGTVVTAVCPVGLAGLRFGVEPLVDPVPDEATLELSGALYDVPVVLQIPDAVPHRVSVLALYKRSDCIVTSILFHLCH